MLQTFIIVLREGFEAFLIVAIMLAYLKKTGQSRLAPAVYWAVGAAVAASAALAYLLSNGVDSETVTGIFGETLGYHINRFFNIESLREGILGLVAIIMVVSLVVHMWRTGHRMKQDMEKRLRSAANRSSRFLAFAGVFLFAFLMITREGMETALLLLQVHTSQIVTGALLGLGAAVLMALAWVRFSHLINLRRFFQVTAVYLLLFMAQVAIYTFHEFSEAGLFPNSDALHEATEPFSPDGLYGKWFSLVAITACALWLIGAWAVDRFKRRGGPGAVAETPAS
ncbi:MAG TPA: FTR1 family protein [Pyrinomonadaceae bacterium]|nr:FTR1 family protein [Pyrinomonadaceae bacterium]